MGMGMVVHGHANGRHQGMETSLKILCMCVAMVNLFNS